MIKPYINYVIYSNITPEEFSNFNFDDIFSDNPDIKVAYLGPEDLQQVMTFINDDPLASMLTDSNPKLVALSRQAQSAISITGSYNASDANALEKINLNVMETLLHPLSISLLDLATFCIFSGDEWFQLHESIAMSFDLSKNVMIYLSSISDDGQVLWMHTRGMLKYGLPDLSLSNVTQNQVDLYYDSFTMLINDLVYKNQVVNNAYESQSDFKVSFTNTDTNTVAAIIFFEGVLTGSSDNPEFNNLHIELRVKDIHVEE